MRKMTIFFFLMVWIMISCKSQPEGYFESSNLPGMIYDAGNRPCDKVLLTVWYVDELGIEEEIIQVRSDINGRFTIPGLKKGSYRILGEKDGYESVESSLFYSSRLDVLYLKILSQKHILEEAAEALSSRRFGTVEELLIRAVDINSNEPYFLYLKSIFLYEKEMYSQAMEQLHKIVSLGYHFPYVHLLMADIYQYQLDRPAEALRELKEYMNLYDDSEMALRLKELENYEI